MNALHFAVSMDAIAPGISSWLLEQVTDEHRDGRGSEEVVKGTLMHRLITLYEEPDLVHTKQQFLSIIASNFGKTELRHSSLVS